MEHFPSPKSNTSISNNLSKNLEFYILERTIYNRLFNYFEKNALLYENQFGFQQSNSTEHALLQLVKEVKQSFENGEYTLGVFVDLSKAFDTVDHEILLKKLHLYGVRGSFHSLLTNYLEKRKQYINEGNSSKQFLPISCGVPQGSILGPLLFIIYVNDLFKASKLLKEVMFTDDTNLFLSGKNLTGLFDSMNTELKNITIWFKSNKLSVNVKKTR